MIQEARGGGIQEARGGGIQEARSRGPSSHDGGGDPGGARGGDPGGARRLHFSARMGAPWIRPPAAWRRQVALGWWEATRGDEEERGAVRGWEVGRFGERWGGVVGFGAGRN
jgi:hypothetical protein